MHRNLLLMLAGLCLFTLILKRNNSMPARVEKRAGKMTGADKFLERRSGELQRLKAFARQNGCCQRYALVADFSNHPGKARLFLVNL